MYESIEATLVQHLALCEETYQLLLDENRTLKQTGQPPDREFLREKQGLLLRFDVSHRAIAEADRMGARHFRQSIEKAQQVILKTLLLDRENEQLLLKCTLGQRPKATPLTVSPISVQKAYGQAVAQNAERDETSNPRGRQPQVKRCSKRRLPAKRSCARLDCAAKSRPQNDDTRRKALETALESETGRTRGRKRSPSSNSTRPPGNR